MDIISKILLTASCFGTIALAHGASHTGLSGDDIIRNIDVDFGPLPATWVRETNVMDPIWEPLGLKGVNYYSYGGPSHDHAMASRLDVESPAYQVWFGVYVIALPTNDSIHLDSIDNAVRVADLDQRSWLQAMGDPNPIGLVDVEESTKAVAQIEGRTVRLFSYEGKSHSDLGTVDTPLRRYLANEGKNVITGVSDFHDLTLHGNFAFFTDKKLGVAVIVYSAAPVFKTADDATHDLYTPLEPTFRALMKSVRVHKK